MSTIARITIFILTIAMLPACAIAGVDGNTITIETTTEQSDEAEAFYDGAMMACVDFARIGYMRTRGVVPDGEAVAGMVLYCANRVEQWKQHGMMEFWQGFLQQLEQGQKPKGMSL